MADLEAAEDKIITGLKQAVAHARGDETGTREHRVEVSHAPVGETQPNAIDIAERLKRHVSDQRVSAELYLAVADAITMIYPSPLPSDAFSAEAFAAPVGEKEDGALCRDHPAAGRVLDEDGDEVCAECHEGRVAEALTEGEGGDETLPAEKWSPLKVIYRNWRGETRERLLYPLGARFGTSEWHPKPGWLLSAIDAETGETREFAMADMDSPASRMEAISTLTAERDAALAEAGRMREAIRGLKFGAYPAHGSGFVSIVTEGGAAIQEIQAALTHEADHAG